MKNESSDVSMTLRILQSKENQVVQLQGLRIITCVSVLVCGCGSTSDNPAGPSSVSRNSPTFPAPQAGPVSPVHGMWKN